MNIGLFLRRGTTYPFRTCCRMPACIPRVYFTLACFTLLAVPVLAQEGSDTVVEMQFSLERISISGEKLMVEHFAPKSDYPRKVTLRGAGIKQGGK